VHALRRAERGERGGVAVRIEAHQPLELGAKLGGHLDLGRVRDRRRIGLEVNRLVPAGWERGRPDGALVAHFLHAVGH
jgi:hypothetical protein